jgi:hypothetical protein
MKNTLLSIAVLSIIAFAGCKKSSSAPANSANVMFVHGCSSGTVSLILDAKVNNATSPSGSVSVPGATSMTFLKNSGYRSVTAGTGVSLSFFVSGLNALVTKTESLTAANHYSAFAGGSITDPVFVFASDDLTTPNSGKAKVRFVNLSPDNLNMSCYVGLIKLDSNALYQACTPFYQVDAATAKVAMVDQVVLANSGQIANQQLVAGKIYTFMLTGSATGSGNSVITLTAIGNN